MNPAVIAFFGCLLILHTQGQHINTSGKCKCLNGSIEKIHPKLIKAGPFIHSPSIFCLRTEIIVLTKKNKEKCVNPQSQLGKLILRNQNKNERRKAVRSTTA